MSILLLINAVIESLVGLLFLFYPGIGELIPGLPAPLAGGSLMLVKMYGTAALILGLFSAFLWQNRQQEVLVYPGLLLFALFHGGVAATQFLYNPDFRPGILHAGLAISFIYFFFFPQSGEVGWLIG